MISRICKYEYFMMKICCFKLINILILINGLISIDIANFDSIALFNLAI